MPFSRRRSLAIKIPSLLSVLLLLAITAMSIASYIELRAALVGMATTRLQQAADQMSNVFGMSARQRMTAMKQLMGRPEVRDYLRTRDAALAPSLDAAIRGYLGTAIAIADVELWDPAGRRVFAAGASLDEVTGTEIDDYKRDLSLVDDASIGRLRHADDAIRYPVGGALSDNGRIIGYVVERRRLNNAAQTRQTVQLLTGLIGNEATFVIGNADGTAWSDLERAIPDLKFAAAPGRLLEYQRSGRPRTYAWTAPINGTPWAVAIEFPRNVVMQPSRRLLQRSAWLGLVLLLASATFGWFVIRRITTPLVQVTEAAEAVAESKPQVHVETDREDEIGRLADSFNTMAKKVELSRLDLELQVELRTSELRAANRELEAFSYSVSHDLRAPLRAIAGFVQILDEDYGATLPDGARRHLERVKVNARRMGQLIDDLLDFSRIGRATMQPQVVDMHALATTIAQEAVSASGRAIELAIDPLPPAFGEPAMIKQALVNLITNAVKFTSRADTPAIRIGARADGNEIVYFIRDNGVGFDDRFAEKLFGVFQRLHRLDEFEGTGVGLAIVHRVVSRHGGRVWAEGQPNAGATFYFSLPAAESTAAARIAQPL